MNFKTPRSSKLPSTNVSSPRKTPLKSSTASKIAPSSKPYSQQSAQNSLLIKLIQTQISSQQQYQNLLIRNKQLQIKILQLEEESQNLKKAYKRASKPLEQIKAKIQTAKASLVEKQKYLQKFYIHLDTKLKSNVHSNLFARLQKIQTALQHKYQQQKQTLYSGLASQHQAMEAANLKLINLKQQRDELIKKYTERHMEQSSKKLHSDRCAESIKTNSENKSIQSNSQKRSHEQNISSKSKQKQSQKQRQNNEKRRRKQEKLIAKQQALKESQFLKENIIRLKKEKQLAEKDSKLLKLLLNIDQEHKKYSSYIINGLKKMFTIKYRQLLTKKKSPLNNSAVNINVSQKSQAASLPDVEGLQKKLLQRTTQRQILQRQILQRNSALQKCKEKLNEEIGEYSMLEEQIMRVSNRNNGNREYNHRMTYVESGNAANHRSTYTSYQQRSDCLDQDL